MNPARRNIFINYRRDDSAPHADRLFDQLKKRFPGRVFRDISGIPLSTDFEVAIDEAIAGTGAFIVVIGDQWAKLPALNGQPRIQQEGDWVRTEIAKALQRGTRVFPVLVDDAKVPVPTSLPEDIRGLSRLQALKLTREGYEAQIEKLISAVSRAVDPFARWKRFALTGALVVAVVVGAWRIWSDKVGYQEALRAWNSIRTLLDDSHIRGGLIGLNVWHMRPSVENSQVRMRGFVHDADPNGKLDWTPFKTSLSTPITEGDYLRLGVQSSRPGFLYIVDRDIYRDGEKGPATLIFPTLRLRGGSNAVGGRIPVEIPHPLDRPPALRAVRTRADQTAIEIFAIVTQQPISDLTAATDAQAVSSKRIEQWEREWGRDVDFVEDRSVIGKEYTAAQREAAVSFVEDSASPFMIFFRRTDRNDPMLAKATIQLVPAKKP